MIDILSFPLNSTYYTAEDFQLYCCTRTNGVYSSDNHFKVTAVTNQPLQISISKGIAWMKYGEFNGLVAANKTAETMSLEISPTTLSRIDRVVIRYNIITNIVELDVKTGTISTSPVAKGLQRDAEAYELAIADIKVKAGQTMLTNGDITDRRLDPNLCGIMRDGVTGIPTDTLYAQWYSWWSTLKGNAESQADVFEEWINTFKATNIDGLAEWITNFQSTITSNWNSWYGTNTTNFAFEFNSWFAELQSVLDENQATNLFNKIDNHENSTLTNIGTGKTNYVDDPLFNQGVWLFTQASSDASYSFANGVAAINGTNTANWKQVYIASDRGATNLQRLEFGKTYVFSFEMRIGEGSVGNAFVNLRYRTTAGTSIDHLAINTALSSAEKGKWITYSEIITLPSIISNFSYWMAVFGGTHSGLIEFRNPSLRISDELVGVHDMRLSNGMFQIYDGAGWVTLVRVQQGITAAYADAKQKTASEFNLLQLTATQFNNLIERED